MTTTSAGAPAAAAEAGPGRPRTVFMYSGQGSQYYGMGRELYQHHGAFRLAMDQCALLFRSLTGRDMVAELYDDARRHDDMTDLLLSHPALFSIGHALTQVVLDAGVRPDAVLGHSLGEYAAAVAAGVLSPGDAMAALVHQAALVRDHAGGGGMLAVLAPADHHPRHPELYAGTALASLNFEQNFVVSGAAATLAALKRRLAQQSIVSMLLPVAHAFHSPAMDPMRCEFRQFLGRMAFRAPRLPMYSAASGGRLPAFDAEHAWRVIRGPADFRGCVDAALAGGPCRFVDLGPSGTLATFIKHGYAGRVAQAPAINAFGRNLQSVSKLIADLEG
jgi:acyl transferase domain-containing protein